MLCLFRSSRGCTVYLYVCPCQRGPTTRWGRSFAASRQWPPGCFFRCSVCFRAWWWLSSCSRSNQRPASGISASAVDTQRTFCFGRAAYRWSRNRRVRLRICRQPVRCIFAHGSAQQRQPTCVSSASTVSSISLSVGFLRFGGRLVFVFAFSIVVIASASCVRCLRGSCVGAIFSAPPLCAAASYAGPGPAISEAHGARQERQEQQERQEPSVCCHA